MIFLILDSRLMIGAERGGVVSGGMARRVRKFQGNVRLRGGAVRGKMSIHINIFAQNIWFINPPLQGFLKA